MNLLTLLVDKGLLSASDRAGIEAELAKKRPLAQVLSDHSIALPDALRVAGEAYGIPSRILGEVPVEEEVLRYIPLDSARHYGFVPLALTDGALEIGITDPDNIEALDALQFISGKIGIPYKIVLITKEDFARVLAAYQNLSGEVGRALFEYDTSAKPASALAQASAPAGAVVTSTGEEELALTGPHETLKEDAPVTKIVSTILR